MGLWLFALGLIKQLLCWPNKTFYCICFTLKNIYPTQDMDLSNTFLAAVLMLKARKFIPYLSSGVFWNGQRTKHDVHCSLFSLNATQNMEINQEMCNSV